MRCIFEWNIVKFQPALTVEWQEKGCFIIFKTKEFENDESFEKRRMTRTRNLLALRCEEPLLITKTPFLDIWKAVVVPQPNHSGYIILLLWHGKTYLPPVTSVQYSERECEAYITWCNIQHAEQNSEELVQPINDFFSCLSLCVIPSVMYWFIGHTHNNKQPIPWVGTVSQIVLLILDWFVQYTNFIIIYGGTEHFIGTDFKKWTRDVTYLEEPLSCLLVLSQHFDVHNVTKEESP